VLQILPKQFFYQNLILVFKPEKDTIYYIAVEKPRTKNGCTSQAHSYNTQILYCKYNSVTTCIRTVYQSAKM